MAIKFSEILDTLRNSTPYKSKTVIPCHSRADGTFFCVIIQSIDDPTNPIAMDGVVLRLETGDSVEAAYTNFKKRYNI